MVNTTLYLFLGGRMEKIELNIKNHLVKELDKYNLTLYSIHFYEESGSKILEILLDNETRAISLQEIVDITPVVSKLLDDIDIINEHYILDISTANLTRPLYELEHYQKVIGKKIMLLLEGKEVIGLLKEVSEDRILIESNKEVLEIKFKDILKGRIF